MLLEYLQRNPVIAGIKSPHDVDSAMAAGIRICFFLTGTIFDLKEIVAATAERDILLFAHVDLIRGIGKDREGMEFLAQELGIDGILTTRSYLTNAAQKAGLLTIQRLFLLDSEALKTGLAVVRNSKPDAVEILPAPVLPNIVDLLPEGKFPPIIAGGLVRTEAEVRSILAARAVAVSTSRQSLWQFKVRR